MFNFRTFSRSRDPSEARFVSTEMTLTEASGERLEFVSVIQTGPFRGKTVTLAYEGDLTLDGETVFGSITRLSVSLDGKTHFEIVPEAPIDVDDFDDYLDDVSDLLGDRGDDDEDQDEDEAEVDEEDEDDEDDDEAEEEDEEDDDEDDEEDEHDDEAEDEDEDEDDEDEDDEDDQDEDDESEDGDDEEEDDDPEGADLADLGDLGAVNSILDALWGGGFAFRGGRRDDDAEGGDGDDEMDGADGDDDIDGGKGRDRLDGGDGDDALAGGGGRDVLRGGHGDDDLDGGRGGDALIGGAGADTFVFAGLADLGVGRHRDVVRGFKTGRDEIDLTGIDANSGRDGNQRFRFLEDDAFSGRAGGLRIEDGVLRGDIDGDGATDFEIRLGRASVDADDLLL